ncbi:pseudouridine synthase [Marasmius fiardii PR-910]|nr:pseudouridine synthase [Marasmius fiardii PR-910]
MILERVCSCSRYRFRQILLRTMSTTTTYENWTKEDLINRIKQLEHQKPPISRASPPSTQTSTQHRSFHFASHPRRKIALKFCYSGWEYNGLAFQASPTRLPTVESVLFDALAQARLVDPKAGFEGCGWEKCGRTDRGVSAAGQVVSLWVRSALRSTEDPDSSRPEEPEPVQAPSDQETLLLEPDDDAFGSLDLNDDGPSTSLSPSSPSSRLELAYVTILNRLLPPTIRILAWSPVSPSFSARFGCKYRHYKYFFSSHLLNIPKMQLAASRLLGDHDFRNMCKVDAGKQITVFTRKILKAEIVPVDENDSDAGDDVITGKPKMHVLNLIGTAFLYHQVRHIMAVLFLIGRGLEEPSVITSLLNVREGAEHPHSREGEGEGEEKPEIVECKPEYQMADALPLVLWDCAYSEEDVRWRVDGCSYPDDNTQNKGTNTLTSNEDGRGIYHLLYQTSSRSEIYATLDRHFLNAASEFFPPPWTLTPTGVIGIGGGGSGSGKGVSYEILLGGGTSRKLARYVPLLQRPRLDSVETINERWRLGKGSRRENRRREALDDGDE